jgi:hypothetical protein
MVRWKVHQAPQRGVCGRKRTLGSSVGYIARERGLHRGGLSGRPAVAYNSASPAICRAIRYGSTHSLGMGISPRPGDCSRALQGTHVPIQLSGHCRSRKRAQTPNRPRQVFCCLWRPFWGRCGTCAEDGSACRGRDAAPAHAAHVVSLCKDGPTEGGGVREAAPTSHDPRIGGRGPGGINPCAGAPAAAA